MPKKPLPTIPPSLTIADLARWIDELGVSFATVDAVIGKAPGAFQKYLNLETKMKHEDFVTLQDWLRIRSEALRRE